MPASTPQEIKDNTAKYTAIFCILRTAIDKINTKRNITIDKEKLDAIVANKLISSATKALEAK